MPGSIAFSKQQLTKQLITQRYQGFIFDLDATLVLADFEGYIFPLLQGIVLDLGGGELGAELAFDFWFGRWDRDQCIRENFGLDPETFWPELHRRDEPTIRIQHIQVIEGVVSVLQRLRQTDKKLAIVTAAVQNMMEAEVALLNFEFDLLLSVSDNPRFLPKPDPAVIYHIVDQWGLPFNQVVLIGDSGEDGHLAINAGVDFVHFVSHGDSLPTANAIFDSWHKFLDLSF
jgi:HAD superfamily hydrolase (TIGR01549 family)